METMLDRLQPRSHVGQPVRSVTIGINNRCPLRCRHCSVGFSNEQPGDKSTISAESLISAISAIDTNVYSRICFAGGEPSLDIALLNTGIEAARKAGLQTAVITAPIWARTSAASERFLDQIPGLDLLILSYDLYHLEFLDLSAYEHAVRASSSRGVTTDLHITYTHDDELRGLLWKIKSFRHLCSVSTMTAVPVGNAAKPGNILMPLTTIRDIHDLARVPRGCILGNALIQGGSVHGCCWSATAPESPFTVHGDVDELPQSLSRLEAGFAFKAVRARGFLDALLPSGQQALVDLVQGRSFSNECHLCITAMREGSDEIWSSL